MDAQTSLLLLLALEMLALRMLEQWTKIVRNTVSHEGLLTAPGRSIATGSGSEDGYRTKTKFEYYVSGSPVVSIDTDFPDVHHVTDFDTQMDRPECNGEKCPEGGLEGGNYDPPEDVEDKEKEVAEDKEKGKEVVLMSHESLLAAPDRTVATRSASEDDFRAEAKFESVVSVAPRVRFAIDFPPPDVDHALKPDTEMDRPECNGEKCPEGGLEGGDYDPPEDVEDKEIDGADDKEKEK